MRRSKQPKYSSVRILTDLSTGEWFWLGSEEGQLSVVDTHSYESETGARDAAAASLDLEPEDLPRAEPNPTEDELAADEVPA